MTSSTPPGLEGQVEAVNPLELFWEKNKRFVQIGVLAVALALGGKYLLESMEASARDETWSGFVSATGLDQSYGEDASSSPFAFAFEIKLPELDDSKRSELASLGGGSDAQAPWALWVLAIDARESEAWSKALGHLDDLESRFGDHLLCKSTPHPVQLRTQVEEEEEEDEDDENKKPKKDDPPEYEAPLKGSAVARLRAQIQAQQSFRDERKDLYEAPEADSAKVVVFKFVSEDDSALNGEIKIRLYEGKAPKHAAAFLELAELGYWTNQAVHERRYREEGEGLFFQQFTPGFSFGWPGTESDQTDEWITPTNDQVEQRFGEEDEAKIERMKELREIDFEDSGASHFAYAVAVFPGLEGKSKATEISIISDDGHAEWDGRRVVVGQVIAGRELVDNIVELSGFLDVEAASRGTGIPLSTVRIEEIRIEDA